jgi:hypothetical protein
MRNTRTRTSLFWERAEATRQFIYRQFTSFTLFERIIPLWGEQLPAVEQLTVVLKANDSRNGTTSFAVGRINCCGCFSTRKKEGPSRQKVSSRGFFQRRCICLPWLPTHKTPRSAIPQSLNRFQIGLVIIVCMTLVGVLFNGLCGSAGFPISGSVRMRVRWLNTYSYEYDGRMEMYLLGLVYTFMSLTRDAMILI